MLSSLTDRTALVVSVLWTISVLAVLFALVPAAWDDSDDVRMSMIAAGIGSQGEAAPMIYMDWTIGVSLNWLYSNWPEIPWYTWLHIAGQFASTTVVSFVVLVIGVRRIALVAVASLQVALLSYFWSHLQFTTTAAMLGMAGASLWILGLSRPHDRNRTALLVFGGLFFLVSSLIRLQSTQLVLLLTGLCLTVTLWRNRIRIRAMKDGLIGGVTVAAIVGTVAFNTSVYRTENGIHPFFADLFAYAPVVNSVQVKRLVAELAVPELQQQKTAELAEIGVEWNDIDCLLSWYLIDEDVFSSEKLDQIHQPLAGVVPRRIVVGVFFAMLQRLVFDNLFLLLAGISLGLAFSRTVTRPQRIVLALVWGGAFAVMAALLAIMKLPPRVYLPAGVTCWIMTMLTRFAWDTSSRDDATASASTVGDERREGSIARVWLTVMILCAAFVTRENFAFAKMTAWEREITEATVNRLIERDDTLQVLLVPFPFARLDPLKSQQDLHEWEFIYLDGHQRSPRQKRIIEAHIGQPLPQAILKNHPEVRFVVAPEAHSLPRIRQFYRTHYRLDVRFPVEEELPWGTVRRFELEPISALPAKPRQAAAEPAEPDSGSGSDS